MSIGILLFVLALLIGAARRSNESSESFEDFLAYFIDSAQFRAVRIDDRLDVKIRDERDGSERSERWSQATALERLVLPVPQQALASEGLKERYAKHTPSFRELVQFANESDAYRITYTFKRRRGLWHLAGYSDLSVENLPRSVMPWKVWYIDTFDTECPPQCEAEGRGLADGLVDLWTRYLDETVQSDGGEGFSIFYLVSGLMTVRIKADPPEGAARVREWVFATSEADAALLRQIAEAHAALCEAGNSAAPILEAAVASADRGEFEQRLQSFAA